MKDHYDNITFSVSKLITKAYSTSFSMGISVFNKRFHDPIYGIYGFVRLADEIVDTFHDYNKDLLLRSFRKDTFDAIENGISLNPVLNSFQHVVYKYGIELELIDTFLTSMEMDLDKKNHDKKSYEKYILGSAEVVGLMCLRVFVDGDEKKYLELKDNAMSLGAAFQKINFLRDLGADYNNLGRTYFPGVDLENFVDTERDKIENDIENDFKHGFDGIKELPSSVRRGVYLAYVYYFSLFKKIKNSSTTTLMSRRIRIHNISKYFLLLISYIKFKLSCDNGS